MDYSFLFQTLAPELILTVIALVILTLDLTVMKESPRIYRMSVGAGMLAFGVFGATLAVHFYAEPVRFPAGMLIQDPLNLFVKNVILFVALVTGLIATEVRFTRNVGEFYALLILSTIGMMLLASTENLLMLFVSLELTSLCLYVLAAYNDRSRESAEAGMKYFLFGGMAAAFLLFGISYLYGITGTLHLPEIAQFLRANGGDPLLNVALVTLVIGFGFKLAAVPFHFWAPDVYQGAPVSNALFIGSASKVASVFAFAKILWIGLPDWSWGQNAAAGSAGWAPMLILMAVASMVFGNLAALAQRSVRRLVAYSAIAHAGYLLIGLLAEPTDGFRSVIYYIVIYAFTTAGLFGVIAAVQGKGRELNLEDFAGFSRKSPGLAICLFIFVLSLAGIPPLAGFFGKFYLFAAALKTDPQNLNLLVTVIIAIAMSAVSLYYYLQLLKQVFVVKTKGPVLKTKIGFLGRSMIILMAVFVVFLGCFPDLMLDRLTAAVVFVTW